MADDTSSPGALDEGTENAALNEALAAEHAAVWGYGVVGRRAGRGLAGSRPSTPRSAHRDVRDQVSALLAEPRGRGRRRRGRVRPALPGALRGRRRRTRRGARGRRRGGVGAGAGPGGRAVDPRARRRRAERRRGPRGGWRAAAGQSPVTRAFPGLPERVGTAQPSAPRKASVTPTATLLDWPPSTRTANAMSPCGSGQLVAHEPAVRVGRGVAAELGGARLAVDLTAAGQRRRRPGEHDLAASSAAARPAPAARARPGSGPRPRRRSPRRVPPGCRSAIAAATSAIWAGLISTSPWPIASAAFVVPVLSARDAPAEDVHRQLPVDADAVATSQRRRAPDRAAAWPAR